MTTENRKQAKSDTKRANVNTMFTGEVLQALIRYTTDKGLLKETNTVRMAVSTFLRKEGYL